MIRSVILLICIGHLLTEVPSLLAYTWPSLNALDLQPFVGYHWPYGNGINALWFAKYAAEDALWICYSCAFCILAFHVNERLFIVAVQWLLYHVLDALMFYYNYKTSYWIYWVLLAVVFGSMVTMFWPRGRMRRV